MLLFLRKFDLTRTADGFTLKLSLFNFSDLRAALAFNIFRKSNYESSRIQSLGSHLTWHTTIDDRLVRFSVNNNFVVLCV